MTLVILRRYSTPRGPLNLERTPLYLRFTVKGADFKTLDALDQLDDAARPEETIIPAKWLHSETVHLDGVRDGKRFGEWHKTAEYETVECELSQEQLRDNQQWREWCTKQAKVDESVDATRTT